MTDYQADMFQNLGSQVKRYLCSPRKVGQVKKLGSAWKHWTSELFRLFSLLSVENS